MAGPAAARGQLVANGRYDLLRAASAPAAFAAAARLEMPDFGGGYPLSSSSVAEHAVTLPGAKSDGLSNDPNLPNDSGLPNDPGTMLASRVDGASGGVAAAEAGDAEVAPRLRKFIPAGQRTLPLSRGDKILLGFRNIPTQEELVAVIADGLWEQLVNGAPNYGTDAGAFGERLGAAGIREASESLFTDATFAPILGEDPRYYVEGRNYSVVHRTLYALTRTLITRKDDGESSINGALLLGYASSAALTNAYYPGVNVSLGQTMRDYGGSLGGAAAGFVATEFQRDILHFLHLRRMP
jgi:hypothetical protein